VSVVQFRPWAPFFLIEGFPAIAPQHVRTVPLLFGLDVKGREHGCEPCLGEPRIEFPVREMLAQQRTQIGRQQEILIAERCRRITDLDLRVGQQAREVAEQHSVLIDNVAPRQRPDRGARPLGAVRPNGLGNHQERCRIVCTPIVVQVGVEHRPRRPHRVGIVENPAEDLLPEFPEPGCVFAGDERLHAFGRHLPFQFNDEGSGLDRRRGKITDAGQGDREEHRVAHRDLFLGDRLDAIDDGGGLFVTAVDLRDDRMAALA
jgi:hypothetical protein